MIPLRFFVPFVLVMVFAIAINYAERPLPRNLGGEWLRFDEEHTPAYHWPAWKRLLFSFRPWGEVGATHAKIQLDSAGAEMSGGMLDTDHISLSKMMPESYAIGISGGLK